MLRIVTLNLNYYVERHGPWEKRRALILEQLTALDPAVVAFQAVAQHPKRHNGKDQAFQICEQLAGFQHHFFQASQTQPDGLKQGSAVIAKFPILEKSFFKLTRKPGLEDTNERVLQRTTFGEPHNLHFYNGHFSWVHEQAITNVEETLAYSARGNAAVTVLAGDMNTLPTSNVFEPFRKAGFRDVWQHLYPTREGYTFESDKPSMRIDYFWVASPLINKLTDVKIISSTRGNVRLSDHLGLMLELDM